jgi:AcrR family transcriptional regulator
MKPSESGAPGLRERKKARTRRLIREQAMRLFREQGYAQTTIDQIAAAAEVSPSTFFRYFPTKEDVVMADDLDPLMVEAFRAQPPELSPIAALRAAIKQVVNGVHEEDWANEMERHQLAMSIPELRVKMFDEYMRTLQLITGPLAERVGRKPDDFEVRNVAGAVIGVSMAVWLSLAEDPSQDVMELVDQGLAHLEAGLRL